MKATPVTRWAPALALAGCALLGQAAAQTADLHARRDALYASIRSRSALRSAAARETASCREELRRCQARLGAAERDLAAAEARVVETRTAIVESEKALHQARRDYDRQVRLAGERVRAMARSGDATFLTVFLGARDFTDLAGRAYARECLAENDVEVVGELAELERALEVRRLELDRRKERLTQERERIAAAKRRIAEETELAEQLTARAAAEEARLSAEIAQMQAESARIAAEIQRATAPASNGAASAPASGYSSGYSGAYTGGFVRPVPGAVSSSFGVRFHPIYHRPIQHAGVDMIAAEGTPVGSAGAGRVIFAGQQSGYGNTVIVDHGDGRTTLYAHLSEFTCSAGQEVGAGQTIAKSGSSGNVTGPHLHFEVRQNGTPVDPLRNGL